AESPRTPQRLNAGTARVRGNFVTADRATTRRCTQKLKDYAAFVSGRARWHPIEIVPMFRLYVVGSQRPDLWFDAHGRRVHCWRGGGWHHTGPVAQRDRARRHPAGKRRPRGRTRDASSVPGDDDRHQNLETERASLATLRWLNQSLGWVVPTDG